MQPQSAPYPVRVRGELEAVSRWRWLIKWLLAIPHYLVLLVLAGGYLVVTVIAFFAILFTGRYPRPLFDFTVGVMRWRWRVAFYAISALGTDRYPPFSLRPKPEYPADLEVDYPERLHRGRVLVKWWLLALPHYLVLALLYNGGWRFFNDHGDHWDLHFVLPLAPLLLLIAMIGLLFTGRYPEGLYDLMIGINRWALRVRVYASLMRDEYPPFRLDMGPREPDFPGTGKTG
ncbi:DUF4389 domain-containing protein [Mycobacterium talmoniae]|nr:MULTISPECIES: DUF4389 domain-containing protein [Mycobacterium]OHU99228.1 DUF4389 domain-containing protein [Mycobacterium talmoniae]TDH57228.1 DUF4389 domain-containing protein [Mycobacterium eburneum]